VLKLKKLQILGFKSFCDRTELKFHGDGIAAIVGPNGCGKSNIADAISWVLGEQSAKSLRGARMEDVIFIGTRERKPTGMAEVTLTLIDPEIYEGRAALNAEAEIEIEDRLPDDWDEASLRSAAAEETAETIEGEQPVPAESGTPSAEASEGAGENPVVLKVRRRKMKPTHFQAGEIAVTRRLFRSGESEYLLNGKICRLRDIQDLFMGTGLGPESYAIIEQGRIGQILSSKPHDRRAIIEEAAGITKFKSRKRLAEARLESSQLNLARINDIFEEVTRQMNSLKRQSAKAERYARLRDEMRAKLRLVLASKFAQAEQESGELEAALAGVTEEMRQKAEAVEGMEAEHGQRQQRGYAIEEESRRNSERLHEIAVEKERGGERRRHNQERCAELDVRSVAARATLARGDEQLANLENELLKNRGVLLTAEAEVSAAREHGQARQREAATASESLARVEREQEARRGLILETASAVSSARNDAGKSEEQVAALDRESARLQQEMTSASSQMAAAGDRRARVAGEFHAVSQRVAGFSNLVVKTRQALEERRALEGEVKRQLDGLRAAYASALGKKGALEALIAEHGYSTESVKRLFQSHGTENHFAPVGVLADFLEVEDQYEGVVENFLRDELNYIVVKSWDAADEGLRLLRSDVDGRATFLVHPEDSQAKFSFVLDDGGRPAPRPDTIVPLKNCIRVLNGFGKSLEVILPKLGHGYIAPDSGLAREMALENPRAFFLAPNGECFHNVTVSGGRQRSEGPLSMKRELREVLRSLGEIENSLRSQQKRAELLAQEITELTSLLDRLEEDKRDSERQSMTAGNALEQLEAEVERARQTMETHHAELSRLGEERQQALLLMAEKNEQVAVLEKRRRELDQELAAAQTQLAGLKQSRERAIEAAGQISAQVAALEERRIAAAGALERIESLAGEVRAQVTALRGEIESAAAEQSQRQAENLALAQQLKSLEMERADAERQTRELQAESEQVRTRLAQIEQQLRELRQALDAARDRRGEISAAAAKLQSDLTYMAEACRNELNLGREELLADANTSRVHGEELAREDAAQRELRARLEAMGPVNMMALEEYRESAERHAFLENQRKDLLQAIEDTKKTIGEIDSISRQKFEEAFARINENFQLTFRKLFGGGQAFMRLTDSENSAESGIDVIASPPGKKLQNVLLLSGGEKALAALALLVGIFQYQPSPFCILDEVDAPLDESNVGRFTQMVEELSVQTQFILITHNKRTMGSAPVLYGVTMQEPGVSKIVSVRLGEAAQAAGL
jgi:chromosome segregation protein